MIFLFDGSFVAKKMKGKRRKKWFLNFFLEVDNFNLFSFFLWWFVWLPSKTEGIDGKEEMKWILWPSVCLILFRCRERKKKQRRKKSFFFFFSLCVALFSCWEMDFMKGKWKERTRKVIFKVFNNLFESYWVKWVGY